jgi:hypothetical protein
MMALNAAQPETLAADPAGPVAPVTPVEPVGPVMEEVKQEQGPGEGAAGATIVKPDKSYKPAPKAPAAKNTNDLKKAMQAKKKPNDAA